MLSTIFAATLISLQAAGVAPDSADKSDGLASEVATEAISEPAPAKAKKITDRNHPEYMRCRRETIIGSRAKKRKICMTNREWERMARKGNATTRSIIEETQTGMNGN